MENIQSSADMLSSIGLFIESLQTWHDKGGTTQAGRMWLDLPETKGSS